MGAYTGTPTILRAWETGDRNGKLIRNVRRISITLSSQGGASNNITAVSLGFVAGYLEKVDFVSFVDDSGTTKRALDTWSDGTYLYTGDPQVATDNARSEPVDVSGVLVVECHGKTS